MALGVTGGGHGEYGETMLGKEQRQKIKELKRRIAKLELKIRALEKRDALREQEVGG